MNKASINWAIIAPGHIAEKYAKALFELAQTDNTISCYAVASRTADKAAHFAQQWGFQKSYGSYDDLLADNAVDAVYIASPHPFHVDLSIKALQAGKQVICEKPAAVNAESLQNVINFAHEKKLFYMEAMWMAFNPCIIDVLTWIRLGKIGTVLHTDCRFCFRNSYQAESRLFNPNLAGGALLDVGIYPLTFAMMTSKAAEDYSKDRPGIFSGNISTVTEPRRIVSSARIAGGIDLWNSAELLFASGMTASLQSAVDMEPADSPKDAYIYGTKGYIRIPQFWMAQEAELFIYKANNGGEAVSTEKTTHPFSINGYEYEIKEASRCILSGKTESSLHPSSAALSVCKVMDTFRSQWRLVYPFETYSEKSNIQKNTSVSPASPADTKLTIYTDGGCSGNPGTGGWACVIIDGDAEKVVSGGEPLTTNNRMELMAAINGLATVVQNPSWNKRKLRIFSDSQYVKNGITNWIITWKKNGWLTSAKKPVLNRELWEELDELCTALDVEWSWVKGHAGFKYNEMCDELCQKEIHAQR
jgi:predicted dehydrogenase/ribonuclease HI